MPDITPSGREETFTREEILRFREDLYRKGKEKESKQQPDTEASSHE
jgi:hypothetical protein